MERIVIPAGRQEIPRFRHPIPIAQFLIDERGHRPIEAPDRGGFVYTQGSAVSNLARRLTLEDWTAVNERFELPENVVWFCGFIRDNDNGADIIGWDEMLGLDGIEPIEVWQAQQGGAGDRH